MGLGGSTLRHISCKRKLKITLESQASWEQFCNDISLETIESWHKIKNFLKPKEDQRDYPAFRIDTKTDKTNTDKI